MQNTRNDNDSGARLHMSLTLRGNIVPSPPTLCNCCLTQHFHSCFQLKPVSLHYQLLKWKSYTPNPVWQRFDVCIYTKISRDGVVASIKNVDADVVVQEQNFLTWPKYSLKANLSGDGVTSIKSPERSFEAPYRDEEFQRIFPMYFTKNPDFKNDDICMSLDICSHPRSKSLSTPYIFSWSASVSIARSDINLHLRGEHAIGIQNNMSRRHRNKTFPNLTSLDSQQEGPDSVEGFTSLSSNSDSGAITPEKSIGTFSDAIIKDKMKDSDNEEDNGLKITNASSTPWQKVDPIECGVEKTTSTCVQSENQTEQLLQNTEDKCDAANPTNFTDSPVTNITEDVKNQLKMSDSWCCPESIVTEKP